MAFLLVLLEKKGKVNVLKLSFCWGVFFSEVNLRVHNSLLNWLVTVSYRFAQSDGMNECNRT